MSVLSSSEPKPPSAGPPKLSLARIWRITRKELRETLRDRRTIVTLLLMPLLVYPLLSLAFRQFLLTSHAQPTETTWSIGVLRDDDYPLLNPLLKRGDAVIKDVDPQAAARPKLSDFIEIVDSQDARRITLSRLNWFVARDGDLEQLLINREIDLGIRILRDQNDLPLRPLKCEVMCLPDAAPSMEALQFFEQRFRAINEYTLITRLKEAGADSEPPIDFKLRETKPESPYVFPMATFIPLILILMTITGAVYPAIDLTAGERERGTLESLVASPMPRFTLLVGKYIAVVTVAVLTALMNITAMTITVQCTGLAGTLFGADGLSPLAIVAVFGLMVLFAAFFSAVLLAVTSFARSFKEAQAYLIPLMLISMTPGFLAAVPSVTLERWWAVTPLANIVLLARDLLENGADPAWAIIALASTLIYALTALVVAAQIFGNDAILYGSQDTWEDWMLRPKHVVPTPTMELATLTLAIIFPLFVWLSGQVGLWDQLSLPNKLIANGIITVGLFVVIPFAMAFWRHVSFVQGFQLRPFAPLALVGALLIGCSMFPIAWELVHLSELLGLADQLAERKLLTADLAKQLKDLPIGLVIVCLAIAPGICEELFFRGFFFTALQRRAAGITVILLSGTIFGLFHVLMGSGLEVHRLFSTTAIGMVLAWIALRTRSIFPGMAAHAMHNSLPLMLPLLSTQFKFLNEEVGAQSRHLPLTWHAVAAVGLVAGCTLVWWSTRESVREPIDQAT